MKQVLVIIIFIFTIKSSVISQPVIESSPIGFASINALGQNGTTGGKGGKVITITNADTLYRLLRNLRPDKNPALPPTIFEIIGTVNKGGDKMVYLKGNANITFIGRGNNSKINGFGFKVQGSKNTIFRNIEFANSPDDAICIEESSHHVWIDHCTFSTAYDGLIDIKTKTQFVTISWCKFYKHSKTCLFGHDDGETADTIMTATYHHCLWDSTDQRHPRVRFGRVHVFNNYYKNNLLYGIASTCDGKIVVEANYFKNLLYPCHIGYADSRQGYINEINNIFENCGQPLTNGETKSFGVPKTNIHNWNPINDYFYTIDEPSNIPSILELYAGSGKLDFSSSTSVTDVSTIEPVQIVTLANYPNPFNPSTTIKYEIPRSSFLNSSQREFVTLKIFDVLGREVVKLVDQEKPAGVHYAVFDATGLSSGIYYAVLQANSKRLITKMLLIR